MYELWDWDTANRINAYPTEVAALAVVASYIRAHGQAAVASWSLLRAMPDADHELIAEGANLANRATDTTDRNGMRRSADD